MDSAGFFVAMNLGLFGKEGLTINYNPVGSGTGIADLETATVDFAGSDPALLPTDRKAMKGPALQFPVAFGAITVSYNVPGLQTAADALPLPVQVARGLSVARIRIGRWPDELWRQYYGRLPSNRQLRRPHSQGRQTGRPAGPAAHHV